ncbi:uncharacterized protein [Dysidea avara]|uniref:uncharacterized protein isoform X2 n=1 Tax=Dysidea avara TaxID=196820 RepID=UPI0033336E3A
MGNVKCCVASSAVSSDDKITEPLLHQEEKEAIDNLLKYYDEEHCQLINLTREQSRALTVLSYSDNEELQRTAAFFFSEISEQYTEELNEVILEPLIHLLSSKDAEVLRAASLALSSLALYGAETNKVIIVEYGGLRPLIRLLTYDHVEVLCNVCGCLTTLATQEENKTEIVRLGALQPLIRLTKSRDIRVKRNSSGALLNLSHIAANRTSIVGAGGVPSLVHLLGCDDEDIQFYCSAAISNIAVDGGHRSVIMSVQNGRVLTLLVKLMRGGREKVQCQACLALRNIASDGVYQTKILQAGGLEAIHDLLVTYTNHGEDTVIAAVAALKNISIHQGSEISITDKKLVPVLCKLLRQLENNIEARCHAAGTIRNLLSVQPAMQALVRVRGITLLLELLTSNQNDSLLVECSAALAIATSHAEVGHMVLESSHFLKMLQSLADYSQEVRHNIVGMLGHLTANAANHDRLLSCDPSLLAVVSMITKLDCSAMANCNFLCLWILAQLSVGSDQTKASLQHFLNKDTFLTQWLHQQQNTTSGDTRQLAAMVMGTTPSLTSNASLSESLTVSQSQKLPSDPSVLRCYEDERAKGNTLLRKGYYSDAIIHYTKCVELCPSLPASYSNRALCHIREGNFQMAEKDCTTSLLIDPNNVKVLFRRSLARKGLSHYSDAIQDIDSLLKVDPNNSAAIKERDLLVQLKLTDSNHKTVDNHNIVDL